MNTGNLLLDEMVKNNDKLDKLQATMDKIEENTNTGETP